MRQVKKLFWTSDTEFKKSTPKKSKNWHIIKMPYNTAPPLRKVWSSAFTSYFHVDYSKHSRLISQGMSDCPCLLWEEPQQNNHDDCDVHKGYMFSPTQCVHILCLVYMIPKYPAFNSVSNCCCCCCHHHTCGVKAWCLFRILPLNFDCTLTQI